MPGFGRTPAGTFGWSVDARGRFVADVVEALDLHDVLVLGHSMGGPVAVSAACQSERIRAVGLICSVGPTMHRIFRRVPGLQAAGYALHIPGVAKLALPTLRTLYTRLGFTRATDAEIIQTGLIVSRFRFRAHRDNLRAVRKPTLVAWTGDDKLVEDAIGDRLYWAAPAGPRIRFETGGHNAQATRASEIAEAVSSWNRSLEQLFSEYGS